ncbi:MAG TPA: hypothetical protein HPP83_03705, partial [Candidatus Hydrogenedentes bacterium]|nr:hypothetical protein [Candidatus Hydrogenedentota bacterium]
MNAVAFLCMAVAVWLRATSIQVNAFTQVNASAEVDAYTYVEAPAFERAWENPPARFEVGANVRQAQVFDEAGREVPCKVQQHRDRRFVFWTRRDDGTAARRYAISLGAKSSFPPPVAVGAGDVFEYGRKKVIDDLAVGMWATPMPIDWDGDGDLDLLVSGTDRPQDGVYVYYRIRRNL